MGFVLVAIAKGAGRRDEIGSPSWLCAVAHHAAQPPRASHPTLYSLLRSRGIAENAVIRYTNDSNPSAADAENNSLRTLRLCVKSPL